MIDFKKLFSQHLPRVVIILIILGLCIFALVWRLINLTVVNQHFLLTQCTERTVRDLVIPSYRGIILDRNNNPLAISTPVYALWIDPKKLDFTPSSDQLSQLAKLILLPEKEIHSLIQKNKKRQFVYLQRDLSPQIATQIKDLKIKGLFLEKQYRRFYPDGEITAPLIGFTNIDDEGQEGLELLYNQWLKGQSGLRKVLKDRYGEVVANLGLKKDPIPGQNLVLSIDSRLQYLAYNELVKGVQQFGAQYGSLVILNIHTGEILAMANAPSFNPNVRSNETNGNHKNRAVTDLYEPGSSVKTFAMTSALISGKYHLNSLINTHPGVWYVEGKKIDDDGHDEGVIDLTRILQVSSNVGMSKVILSIPHSVFLNLLSSLGFGQPTGINFPGESKGFINKNVSHSDFVYATVSFGYAITVNLLQLAHAYATLANDGVMVPLTLLKASAHPVNHPTQPIIPPKITAEIRSMLESVLKKGGGTATAARVYNYRVTGKTGTTRILGPHGYDRTAHNGFFVGIAPATRPELVVAVFLHKPTKKAYFGGDIAGPIFSKVMGDALRILNVPPDDIQTQH
jgi:cell division protein FtsI (penicillin-binding protein 3)